jgi:hypothetical protein
VDKYKFYQANEKDLDALYEMLKKFKIELRNLKLPNISEEKLFNTLETLITKGKIICCNLNESEKIIGAIAFFKTQHWWSEKILYNIHFVYVLPEHRNFIIFRNLLGSVKKIAKDDPINLVLKTWEKIGD